MIKVLVITDSLGLPRKTPEVVLYQETWVHQLSKQFALHQISIGGGVVEDLFTQVEYAKMFDPDIVIVQSGIVDCAPRALTKLESLSLNRFWLTRKILKGILKPGVLKFLRTKRNKKYTEENKFEKNVANFIEAFHEKLYWIEILPASNEYELLLPGIKKNVEKYNAVLKKQLKGNFIGLDDIKGEHIMSDNIHLSSNGHAYLFSKIKNLISQK